MRSGIRSNVLLVAVAPAALISLLLLTYLTNTRIRDLEQALTDRGQAIANQLAPGYAFAIEANRFDALEQLAGIVLQEPDVHRVTIFDHRGTVIAAQRRNVLETQETKPSDWLLLSAQIRPASAVGGPSNDVRAHAQTDLTQASSDAPIGRVEVALSRVATVKRQHQVIATGLGLTLICLALATILGMRIGRKVTEPILQMESVLQQIRRGDLEARVTESSSGHLGNLERGINAMASSLRESHANLREEVTQATADLRGAMRALEIKNSELEVARKRALGASRVKSEFLANVSHEIRTPLNGVLGFIELLEQTELDPTQRDYVETVSSCAGNLLGLVNDILDLSKIEAGRLELRRGSFDVRETIENAALVFAANAHSKDLNFSLDIEPDVPDQLHGDAARISQIASNLVSNAIKFTESGEVEVHVAAAARKNGDTLLKLTVRDTGIGIPQAEQTQLFNAFSQLDSSYKRRHTGSGLGLAISKRLTDLMGGTIAIESRSGKGTSFRVALPLAESRESDIEAAGLPAQGEFEALVATDAPHLARAVSHILDNAGAKSVWLRDDRALHSALKWNGEQPASLALVLDADFNPAELGSFVDELHRVGEHCAVTVVILGSPCTSSLAGRLESQQISVQHVAKPPRSAALIKTLRAGLNRRQARESGTMGSVHALAPRTGGSQGKRQMSTLRHGDADGTHVLLADDNPVNRRLAAIFLKQLGVRVDEVENGEEAVEACRSTSYDLVLMDVHMPVMDGVEATRQIRALGNNCNARVPIVALTADAMHEERERFLRSGMDDHIAKPITLHALCSLVELWRGREVAQG